MVEPNVLFVSYEFGSQISGGVARVINGLYSSLVGKVKFDIFVLRWSTEISTFTGDLYLSGGSMHRYHSRYIETVRDLVNLNSYNIVHIMHAGEHTYDIVRCLRQEAVKVEIVFSLHSIMKHDLFIRKASKKDLFHEDFLLKNSDHIHLLSETARQWVKAAYPEYRPNSEFHIIPNAIHCPSRRKNVISNLGVRTVLCISRWSHGKGLEYLIDAIPYILAVLPNVRFILAGRKESSWENDVAAYVKKIDEKIVHIDAHIEVFGWVDDAQRAALCEQASVVVMPSAVEYFPYAILEPAAEGIPIVSSRIAGAQEILADGTDCLMYETTDVRQLAENILTLLCNSELADRLAANAYNRVATKFTWDKISGMYRHMYMRMLGTDFALQSANA